MKLKAFSYLMAVILALSSMSFAVERIPSEIDTPESISSVFDFDADIDVVSLIQNNNLCSVAINATEEVAYSPPWRSFDRVSSVDAVLNKTTRALIADRIAKPLIEHVSKPEAPIPDRSIRQVPIAEVANVPPIRRE